MKKKDKKKKSLLRYLRPLNYNDIFDDLDSIGDLGSNLGSLAFVENSGNRFLNRFSIPDIRKLMDRVGLSDHIFKKGYTNIIIHLEKDDSLVHYMKVYSNEITPDRLLIDLRISESRFSPERKFFEEGRELGTLDMIIVEWLSSEDPNAEFTESRPQLPGQSRPGLGAMKYLVKMMYIVAKEVIKDGFIDVPDHIHGAIMYSKNFKFFNPSHEGTLRAIMRDLCDEYPLLDISWGIITRTIINVKDNLPLEYKPSEQIFPVSGRMKSYFSSKMYNDICKHTYKSLEFRLDYDEMERLRSGILKSKLIIDL